MATPAAAAWISGLSPRTRGKLSEAGRPARRWRSIPAYAGETFGKSIPIFLRWVYPRVRGGNLLMAACCSGVRGLSPRTRGKLMVRSRPGWRGRSIPAYAGETSARGQSRGYPTVYPRVRGGNGGVRWGGVGQQGLSPRTRGKQTLNRPTLGISGSIPAYAGETLANNSFINQVFKERKLNWWLNHQPVFLA